MKRRSLVNAHRIIAKITESFSISFCQFFLQVTKYFAFAGNFQKKKDEGKKGKKNLLDQF